MSDLKDEFIRMFFDEEVILFGCFILMLGKESNYYINVKKFSIKFCVFKFIVKFMVGEVQKRGIIFDRVVGLEFGVVLIVIVFVLEIEKLFVIVRKKLKGYGIGSQFEGEVKVGDKVFFVEDVIIMGGSVLRVVEVFEREGVEIVVIMVVVDREEGVEEIIGVKYIFFLLVRVLEFFVRRKEFQKE